MSKKIIVTLTEKRLQFLGANHIENATDLFDRISAKISKISAGISAEISNDDLIKRLVLLMFKADLDSDDYGVSIGEKEVLPYIQKLKAEGLI